MFFFYIFLLGIPYIAVAIDIEININYTNFNNNPTSLNSIIEIQEDSIETRLLAYNYDYEAIPTLCPAHHYCPRQHNSSATTPIPCPPYSRTLTTGSSSIEDCIVQRDLCPTGTYFSQYEKAACTVCEPGFYCQDTFRYQCPPNTYNPSYGLTQQCLPCTKDGFWVTNNSTTCTLCPPGFMCIQGTAIPCPIDMFNPVYGATQCLPCPKGTYANPTILAKTDRCQPCPLNHVCFDPLTIEPCPEETVSPEGSTSLLNCMCKEDYACQFRKEVSVKLDITAEQELTSTEFEEIASNLENDQEFVQSLTYSYALAMSLDVSQVVFKGLDIVT